MSDVARLTPAASSRKLLVLAFVRDYVERFGRSPSTGEIAAAQGISTRRVKDHLKTLAREGEILRQPGARRGIVLPDQVSQALRVLVDQGWKVFSDARGLVPPFPNTHLADTGAPRDMGKHVDGHPAPASRAPTA